MDNLLLYLLKVSAGTTLFYLSYLLFFSKDTFYMRNRVFLILTLLLPTILPALKIPILSNSVVPVESTNTISNIASSDAAFETTMSSTINSFDYNKLLIWIYFIITGLLLLKGIISLISTYRIIKKGVVKSNQFPKVIISDDQLPPFSFFPYAVIPAENYKSGNYIDILDHESAHIKQGHTFDLLLSELFIAFQWFNPFVWLIKRSIILNHEYLADHVSLIKNRSVKEYQYRLLNFQTGLKHISIAHRFNSLIKNRILMINKKPTRRYATLKNILIFPLIAIGFYSFAKPEYHYAPLVDKIPAGYKVQSIVGKEVKGTVVNEEGNPIKGATVIIPGTHTGVSTDASGHFTIGNVPEDSHLIISSKGCVSQYLEPAFSSEMTVKMLLEKGNPESLLIRDSFKNGPHPLIIINGVESNKRFNEIDENEIRSMTIVSEKDAIHFGEKGKNGVIFITTKTKASETGDNKHALAEVPTQKRTISGLVTGDDNFPIRYVAVVVKGTPVGDITDSTGHFTIRNVPEGASLVFSLFGYEKQILKPVYDSYMSIKMVKDPENIFGTNSPNEPSNHPLWVVDGVISEIRGNLGMDPTNISFVRVLKDKAATDKYGEKGKDGVIEITTKKKASEVQIATSQTQVVNQTTIKGIVLKEDGKPLEGVSITTTGTMSNTIEITTGADGRFSFTYVKPDALILFSCNGFKPRTLKPVFSKTEMVVKMETDPEYKVPATGNDSKTLVPQRPNPIVVIDGVISVKSMSDARKDLGYDMGIVKMLMGKEATDKYGEKGANGVIEIITRKKALAMGLKPPFPRLAPEDFPTFQNQKASGFTDWVISQVKYPADAKTRKVEGWVSVNFKIDLDGSISNVISTIPVDKMLSDEVIRAVLSSPKWDAPKNPKVDEPFNTTVTLKFKLPDQILNEAPFVVVEKMPTYPGGEAELMKFIKANIKYPEEAKTEKIQGRVILRFIINTEGKAEAISVLRGVHPLLDAEAIRVISMLNGWNPGTLGGKPVNVWYSAPVTFSLPVTEIPIVK
jgi:TonB family protein